MDLVNKERVDFLKGRLKIVIKEDDKETVHFEDDNLIVNTGKQIVLASLYPSSLADSLQYGKVGTGGASDAGGLFLKTPTVDMTDLYQPVANMGIGKIAQNLLVPNITLVGVLDNTQGNGLYINEAGFFSGTGYMFNIKTFPRIYKTRQFSLNFEWVISVS